MQQKSSPASSLQFEEHPDFHRRNLRFQHVAWVALALLIVAAVLGLFGGGGVWSKARLMGDNGAKLEYERFARRGAPSTLVIRLAPSAGRDVRVRLERSFVERVRIESVAPEPVHVEIGVNDVVYVFASPAAASVMVGFHLHMENGGLHRNRIEIEPGTTFEITQLVYP